jgi:hypothetical protein
MQAYVDCSANNAVLEHVQIMVYIKNVLVKPYPSKISEMENEFTNDGELLI